VESFVRVMVMVPGLTLRFRLKFVSWPLPVPTNVEADATVVLKLPKVPSGLAPNKLLFQSLQFPPVPLVVMDAVVSASTWVTGGAVTELNVSQPATSVSACNAAGVREARRRGNRGFTSLVFVVVGFAFGETDM
jgi:hypothetical protein